MPRCGRRRPSPPQNRSFGGLKLGDPNVSAKTWGYLMMSICRTRYTEKEQPLQHAGYHRYIVNPKTHAISVFSTQACSDKGEKGL